MKKEDVKRWEIIEARGKRYLRDRHKNEGILIEIHESQVVTEDVNFITIFCNMPDFNFKRHSIYSFYDLDACIFMYMFKKWENCQCYTLFQ